MSQYMKTGSLLAFCCWAILMAGCFPEDSLEWSDDGSVGILRSDQGLYLVDGDSGELTPVVEGEILPWPHLSGDGTQIVYSEEVEYTRLSEGLKALSIGQLTTIENDAKRLRDKILSDTFDAGQFQWDQENVFGYPFGYPEVYRSWVARYVCERADERLAEKLGTELIEEGKASELSGSRLVVVARSALDRRKVITTGILPILRPRFSPDGRYVAYLALDLEEAEHGDLFVASSQPQSDPMYVTSQAALGFDWRPNGRAIAYIRQESEDSILAVVAEQQICAANGQLLEDVSLNAAEDAWKMHCCTGESRELAGTLFQPLMKVQYGIGDRLFFTSPSARIPTSDLDESKYALFCYDFVTGTVAEVLPAGVRDDIGETINFFALSPDRRRVLLPLEQNRFAVYELGATSAEVPLEEAEGFGEEMPDLLPAWKSNTQLSCLVSGRSHFLADRTQRQDDRHEIVVLNAQGDFHSHLSKDWPDDIMP